MIFTDPEIGTIVLDPERVADAGHETLIGEFPLRASDRTLSQAETDGFVHLIDETETGKSSQNRLSGRSRRNF